MKSTFNHMVCSIEIFLLANFGIFLFKNWSTSSKFNFKMSRVDFLKHLHLKFLSVFLFLYLDARNKSWLTFQPYSDFKLMIVCLFSEVCSIRLDFEVFSIRGPIGSDELDGGRCSIDTFSIIGTPEVTNLVPIICGENSGSHSKYTYH